MSVRMNATRQAGCRPHVAAFAAGIALSLASLSPLGAAPFEEFEASRSVLARATAGEGRIGSERVVSDRAVSPTTPTPAGDQDAFVGDLPNGYHDDGCVGDSGLLGACPPMCPPLCEPDCIAWVGRVDALIAWRSAPPDRPLVETGLSGVPVLNANGMDSTAAAGPRFSIFRFNHARGTGWETSFFQLANWRSERPLAAQSNGYALAPPGFYGNTNTFNFDTGVANLGSRLKSLEVNRHWVLGENLNFLAGFRWVEWEESFSLTDEFVGTATIQDFYRTDAMNSLYGGQIGLDAVLFTLPWMRVDSVVKAGVYGNNAVQTSLYQSDATGGFLSQSVTVGESPVSAAFLGEVGITGVVPVTDWLDIRVGYSGWWLSGIVQPTQQLSGQVLTQPAGGIEPTSGTITANGGVLVQAVTLGLEGRW